MKKIFIFLVLLTTACSSIPGGIDLDVDHNKNYYEVVMEPGFASKTEGLESLVRIGAIKNSKMKKDEFYLVVRNDAIEKFSFNSQNFFLFIDGKEYGLSSLKFHTDCEKEGITDVEHCQQSYLVNLDFLNKIVNSDNVTFRLDLATHSVNGTFRKTGATSAKGGIKNFLEELKSDKILD
jgi:hypothetical protein